MARPVCARCTATIIMPPSSSIPTDTGLKRITALAKGESNAESARRLQPLATNKMPLEVPPPRGSRFGSPLVLSRVHWVRPELVVEVKYLAWTGDNLLRQVVYEGLREDKPAAEVRREMPHQKPGAASSAVTHSRRPRG